jgi:hypothetical protein
MAVSINNLTVSSKAPANTIIGGLALRDETGTNQPAHFLLTENSAGFFNLSGASLRTTLASLPAGFYSVRVDATANNIRMSAKAYFVIQVTNA